MRINISLALLVLAGVACSDDEITHVRIAKAPASDPAAAVEPPEAPGAALQWQLPKGWTERREGSGMRYATLVVPVEGKLDVSVTVLPGDAGGELANVNRWRGQIGLAPFDEAALAASRRPVTAPAGKVGTWDFASEGADRRRTIAGLLSAGGSSWFLKMTGDAEAVASARADFLRLLATLRLEAKP
jgi:hypothetical protein